MKILIVDDHALVREGFRRILSNAFTEAVIAEAENAGDAIASVRAQPWDVVVLDVSLGGRSGLDALKELREIRKGTRVLVATMHDEKQYALRAFRSGADGYITKSAPVSEIVAAVRKIAAGGKYVTATLAEKLAAAVSEGDGHAAPHESLSDRELEVLRLLGSGKTVKEISSLLSLSDKTVSTYRTRILEKMAMRTTAELVHYAVSVGLHERS